MYGRKMSETLLLINCEAWGWQHQLWQRDIKHVWNVHEKACQSKKAHKDHFVHRFCQKEWERIPVKH